MSEERKSFANDAFAQKVIDEYWERRGKPLFQYTILKETFELRTKSDEAFGYLLKIFEQYPDSPGILSLLVNHFCYFPRKMSVFWQRRLSVFS